LVNNEQFKAVLARKKRVSNDKLALYTAENDCGYPRLGISVSKSISRAVIRNRLKRVLREVFRQYQHQIPQNFDYLVMLAPRWAKHLNNSKSYNNAVGQTQFQEIKTAFLDLIELALKRERK
jgi:ribonuclease P protein component